MSVQTNLSTLRAELKQRLANGEYDPLAERLSKWLHRTIPRLPKNTLSAYLVLSSIHLVAVYLLNYSDGVEVFKEWLLLAFLTIFFSGLAFFSDPAAPDALSHPVRLCDRLDEPA
ncbi:MAG: hypothetical protein IPJ47_13155 [Anaerolineales bacterium]|nr:hypothetical protein [Anaerolineales bacterium]